MPVAGNSLADLPGGVQSFGGVRRRHPDVQHDQVGRQVADQRENPRAVAGLPDDLKPRPLEQAGQPLAEEDVVLRQKDARYGRTLVVALRAVAGRLSRHASDYGPAPYRPLP
jgi:hypothetical protein